MTQAQAIPAPGVSVGLDQLAGLAGQTIGASTWHLVTQDQVNRFAEATGDSQWIHVDPAKAAAGPFGATVAHGYLTLALTPVLLSEVLAVHGTSFVVNYGANRVRFPSPVPVGTRVRAVVDLLEAVPFDAGVQAVFRLSFEVEGTSKPACVAEIVFRYYTTGGA